MADAAWGACIIASYKDRQAQSEGEKTKKKSIRGKNKKEREKEKVKGIESNKDWTKKNQATAEDRGSCKLFYIVCLKF